VYSSDLSASSLQKSIYGFYCTVRKTGLLTSRMDGEKAHLSSDEPFPNDADLEI
jgi:hypothetical protein